MGLDRSTASASWKPSANRLQRPDQARRRQHTPGGAREAAVARPGGRRRAARSRRESRVPPAVRARRDRRHRRRLHCDGLQLRVLEVAFVADRGATAGAERSRPASARYLTARRVPGVAQLLLRTTCGRSGVVRRLRQCRRSSASHRRDGRDGDPTLSGTALRRTRRPCATRTASRTTTRSTRAIPACPLRRTARQLGVAALKRYIDRAHQLGLRVLMDCVLSQHRARQRLGLPTSRLLLRGSRRPHRQEPVRLCRARLRQPRPAFVHDRHDGVLGEVGGVRRLPSRSRGGDSCLVLGDAQQRDEDGEAELADDRRGRRTGSASTPGHTPGRASLPGETYDNVYAFDAIYGFDVHERVAQRRRPTRHRRPPAAAVDQPDGLRAARAARHGVVPRCRQPRPAAESGCARRRERRDARRDGGELHTSTASRSSSTAKRSATRTRRAFTHSTYIDWTRPPHPEDAQVFAGLLTLRRTHPALARGTTTWCATSGSASVVSYLRTSADGVVVVVNLSSRPGTNRNRAAAVSR